MFVRTWLGVRLTQGNAYAEMNYKISYRRRFCFRHRIIITSLTLSLSLSLIQTASAANLK
jgi:hypothetical protein